MNLNVIYHLLKFWVTYKYEGLIKDIISSVKNMTRKPGLLKIGGFFLFFNEMELQERVGSVRGLQAFRAFQQCCLDISFLIIQPVSEDT